MQKNWYVLYTKPQFEKKVAGLLTKKKVENFIPLICVEKPKSWRNKLVYRPLFNSYVFVHTTQDQAISLLQADGVINMLYWLGKPAIVNETEIDAIKELTADYQNINLEKLTVNSAVTDKSIYQPSYEIEGNILAVKNRTIKINLPSLGYALIAKLKEDSIFGKEHMLLRNYAFAQS